MKDKRILLLATLLSAAVIVFAGYMAVTGAHAQSSLTPMEELGKDIFFDVNLSIHNNESCAACHAPEAGWTGPLSDVNAHGAVYEGSVPGRFGNRKPPSAAYATQSPVLHYIIDHKEALFIGGNFWDGRATGEKLGNPAADQAQGPFLNPLEQALPDATYVVDRICTGAYAGLFQEVWGQEACDPANVYAAYDYVALSIAAYEASPEVNAFSSKYDATFMGTAKLDKLEQRGYALFRGKGMCHRCHTGNGQEALFTDFTFDNLGVPRNPENPFYESDFNPLGMDWVDLGLGGFLERAGYAPFAQANMGKQKVPTLRNVGLGSCEADPDGLDCITKAYTHNGYFKSLYGLVHFYNTRDVLPRCADPFTTEADAVAQDCWPEPEVMENVNTDELGDLGLSEDEERAIVAFLLTLSDGYVP